MNQILQTAKAGIEEWHWKQGFMWKPTYQIDEDSGPPSTTGLPESWLA